METKPVPFAIWETLEKIEFHETKEPNYFKAGIETRFYIKPEPCRLHDFLKWCDRLDWKGNYKEEEFAIQCKKAMASKRDNPYFKMYINRKDCTIYPKQSYIAVYEVGIHYICQHSFDLLPLEIRELFYSYINADKPIGKLYPIPKKYRNSDPLIVKAGDIDRGFMLSKQEIDEKYDDSFVEWIKHRRFKEAK